MSGQQTGSSFGTKVLIGIFAFVVGAFGIFYFNEATDESDDIDIPVEFFGRWTPGDNEPKFYYLIGVRGDTLRPVGPEYTHDDNARLGDRLELLIESDPEQPIVITECFIEYLDEHIEGTVSREGAICQVIASIPTGE